MPLATAHAADTMIGTADIGERLVIPATKKPNKTLRSPILLRIDQLSSKYIGTPVEDMMSDGEYWGNEINGDRLSVKYDMNDGTCGGVTSQERPRTSLSASRSYIP